MQEENLLKMSEMATPPLMETYTANILICYLLYKIGHPIETEQLYDIAVGENIITYFYYQESITYLEQSGSLIREKDVNNREVYRLGKNGTACAKELKNYVGKPYRDKILTCAMRYFARKELENSMKIQYEQTAAGYLVHVSYQERKALLFDMKLYAASMQEAEHIAAQVKKNPVAFYQQVIRAAFQNKEENVTVDLSNN